MTRNNGVLLLGVLLILAGPAWHALQVASGDPDSPTYLPYLAGAGAAALAVFAALRRSRVAVIGAGLGILLALGVAIYPRVLGTAEYDGPAKVGVRLQPFTLVRADGTPFTLDDLKRGGPSVLVFFRHW